jgi:hypothetical protein
VSNQICHEFAAQFTSRRYVDGFVIATDYCENEQNSSQKSSSNQGIFPPKTELQSVSHRKELLTIFTPRPAGARAVKICIMGLCFFPVAAVFPQAKFFVGLAA